MSGLNLERRITWNDAPYDYDVDAAVCVPETSLSEGEGSHSCFFHSCQSLEEEIHIKEYGSFDITSRIGISSSIFIVHSHWSEYCTPSGRNHRRGSATGGPKIERSQVESG